MNRIIAQAVIAVVVMSVSDISAASDKAAVYATGNTLLAWCLSASRSEQRLCDGYILGVADVMLENKKIGDVAACIPVPVRSRGWSQILNVVQRFLASHPEKRSQLSATNLVARALAEAYPCQ